MESSDRSYCKFSKKLFAMTVAVLLCFFLIGGLYQPREASCFWPFTSDEEKWVAKVGDEVISLQEYIDAMNVLHTSQHVGRELSLESSFQKQNYEGFLGGIIDVRLMRIEAENLSLHMEPAFVERMDTFTLNLKLERLRQDEITNKVKVKSSEIEKAYIAQIGDKLDPANEDGDSVEIPYEKRSQLKADILKKKSDDAENALFEELRTKAEVNIVSNVFETVSVDDPESYEKIIAEVNGLPIFGRELIGSLKSAHSEASSEKKKAKLDQLVMYKIIDIEAMSRPYEKEEEIAERIKKFRDDLLEKFFKIQVILPSITVTEEEIVNYYESNLDKYKESDLVDVAVIITYKKKEAEDVLTELLKGADFSFLAKKKSVDTSAKKGGDVGWTRIDTFPKETRKIIYKAKEGDLIGPFSINKKYAVAKFRSLNKGGNRALDDVLKEKIDKNLGREKFKVRLDEYLRRLREVVPIKINEKELTLLRERT